MEQALILNNQAALAREISFSRGDFLGVGRVRSLEICEVDRSLS